MQRKTASDFAPEVMQLFDQYVHGLIDRRGFLNGATRYAVGGISATMLLDMLNPKFAEAQQIKTDDPRIKARYVDYPSPDGHGKMRGYLVTPAKASGSLPGVLVVHENRGLIRIRKMSRGGWRLRTSSLLRPMHYFRWVAIPAMRTKRGNCSPNLKRPNPPTISLRRPAS